MIKRLNVLEDAVDMYNLYIMGKWKEVEKKLLELLDSIRKDGSDFVTLKNIAQHVGVTSVLLDNEEIIRKFIDCIDNELNEYEKVVGELYLMNVFDNTVWRNIFSREDQVKLFEMIIEKTCKDESKLSCMLASMCNIHNIQEEFYDLSDVVRRVALHLIQEDDDIVIMKLENILKKFMPIIKLEDIEGFLEITDILSIRYDNVFYEKTAI